MYASRGETMIFANEMLTRDAFVNSLHPGGCEVWRLTKLGAANCINCIISSFYDV